MTRRAADFGPLLAGVLVLALGTALGWSWRLLEVIVMPPPLIRAMLVGGAVILAVVLFGGALRRLAGDGPAPEPDWPSMVRGIRLAFLGVAALAAGAGWMLGHPLPIVVALVIAGVDVVETSFLVVVARARGR